MNPIQKEDAFIIAAVFVCLVALVIYQTWEIESLLLECKKRYGVECELIARPKR